MSKLSQLLHQIFDKPQAVVIQIQEEPTKDLTLIERVVKYMDKQGYSIDKNENEINIVYLEGFDLDGETPNDNTPDKFNDARLVFKYIDGKPKILGAWEATTEPGKYWTEHPMNSDGAARIRFGQQAVWQRGYHHDDPNHEALVQTGGPIEVYRDTDETYKREGKIYKGWFGINQHWGYDLSKDSLGRSSAGCLVGRTKDGHREFMKIVKSDPRFIANKKYVFKATVIPAKEI